MAEPVIDLAGFLALLPLDGPQPEPELVLVEGLGPADADAVGALLARLPAVEATLGEVVCYRRPGHDLLAVRASGADLEALHALACRTLPLGDEPAYDPHVPLARLRPGEGADWHGDPTFQGKRLALHAAALYDGAGVLRKSCPLLRKAWVDRGPDKGDPTGKRKVWYDDDTGQTRTQIVMPGTGRRGNSQEGDGEGKTPGKAPPGGAGAKPTGKKPPPLPAPAPAAGAAGKFKVDPKLRPEALAALKDLVAPLRASKRMTVEQKVEYATAAQSVLSRMTPEALARFRAGHSGTPSWAGNTEQLQNAIIKVYADRPRIADKVRAASNVGGAYVRAAGKKPVLVLDGGHQGEHAEQRRRMGMASTAEEIYAHEFAHAIDGPAGQISRSGLWASAWQAELAGSKEMRYAGTSPSEGLAEFGRLLLTGQDPRDLKARFPKCYDVWERTGLAPAVEARPAVKPPPLPEVFASRMDLPNGGHADVLAEVGERARADRIKERSRKRPGPVRGALSRLGAGARAALSRLTGGGHTAKALRKALRLVELGAATREDELVLAGWLAKGWRKLRPAPDGRRFVWQGTPPDKGQRVQISEPNSRARKPEAEEKKPAPKAKAKPKAKADPAAVKARIAEILKGEVTPGHVDEVAQALEGLTKEQIHSIKKELNLKASGAKPTLARKVAERALAAYGEPAEESAPPPKPAPKPPPQPAEDDGIDVGELGGPWDDDGGSDDLPEVGTETEEKADADAGDFYPDGYEVPDADCSPNPLLPGGSRPRLTLEQAEALSAYSLTDYAQLNAALFEGTEMPGPVRATHEGLREAFALAEPFPEPVTVLRGLDILDDQAARGLLSRFKKAAASGGTLRLPGYQSTSTGEGFSAEGNFTLRIAARKGLDLRPYSKVPEEDELLLDHDGEYLVKGVKKGRGGNWVVDLEQVL